MFVVLFFVFIMFLFWVNKILFCILIGGGVFVGIVVLFGVIFVMGYYFVLLLMIVYVIGMGVMYVLFLVVFGC